MPSIQNPKRRLRRFGFSSWYRFTFSLWRLEVALQTARLLGNLRHTCVVTYRQRTSENLYLFDLLKSELPSGNIVVGQLGLDIPFLLSVLKGRRVIYQAHSSGYGFHLPPGVPIIAVSRNTLGYWGSRAPRNPLFSVYALDAKWFKQGNRLPKILTNGLGANQMF